MANRGRRAVLSVDYRRPPEALFPAAPDDLDTVVGWLRREGPPAPYAAHGDSAGANLALVAALRNPGSSWSRSSTRSSTPAAPSPRGTRRVRRASTRPEAHWYWEQYARTEADFDDPDLAPLLSDRLHTLPPTFVASAEADPLRDEGEELARLLAEAGWRPSASAASGRPTASGGMPTSRRPSPWSARWRAGSTSTSSASLRPT